MVRGEIEERLQPATEIASEEGRGIGPTGAAAPRPQSSDDQHATACYPYGLTAREVQVLDLIGRGLSTKEIAGMLGRSVETISNHRKHICKKLGIHSTAELVLFGSRKYINDLKRSL